MGTFLGIDVEHLLHAMVSGVIGSQEAALLFAMLGAAAALGCGMLRWAVAADAKWMADRVWAIGQHQERPELRLHSKLPSLRVTHRSREDRTCDGNGNGAHSPACLRTIRAGQPYVSKMARPFYETYPAKVHTESRHCSACALRYFKGNITIATDHAVKP